MTKAERKRREQARILVEDLCDEVLKHANKIYAAGPFDSHNEAEAFLEDLTVGLEEVKRGIVMRYDFALRRGEKFPKLATPEKRIGTAS